ncbi:translation elongation factor Ts [Lactobacillus iners]|nr:translation elongation factor Ts [Lactobacillus iners]EFO65980.1 translation elongation factor Ts [Lactobacillus iners LactinV 11V1-d]EFO67353.1 translation elongation factor Ts [Lactobacillus iners LactinV 09V1-c]EFO68624.1 translation elongation factor Ts [Lactobacillus iners LactinV 03V1-b]EFO70079.1 translation elongation factor Ts [Lactobacillus iners LactinV 01V1-a]EFO72197.1 translation elongation factor Ts [Lactobacillus iners SPIN 2503V10-D]
MAKITAAQVKELRERTGAGMMDVKKALVKADGDMDKATDILRESGAAKAAKKSGRIAAEGLAAFDVEGNNAVLVEINSETDFVSSNDKFVKFVDDVTKAILAAKPADLEAAMNVPLGEGTIASAETELTAVIGEKITLRRFTILTKKDNEVFGAYKHNNGAIIAVTILDGDNAEAAKNIAMHVAAINPEYLDKSQVPAEVLEHQTDVFTKETEKEGKPSKIIPKIVEGRMNKYLAEICLVDQPYVKDSDMTVAEYVKSVKSEVKNFVRYEVGEGIEKKQEDFAAEVREQMR